MENFLYALSNVNLKNIITGVALGSVLVAAICLQVLF